MGQFAVGNIVLVAFPFSNLKGRKLRPALVVAEAEFGDLVLCQITSNPYGSKSAMKLEAADFAKGKLPATSFVRPDKLFTADISIVQKNLGALEPTKQHQIITAVRGLFN